MRDSVYMSAVRSSHDPETLNAKYSSNWVESIVVVGDDGILYCMMSGWMWCT